jgi:hypothetical protein
MYSVCPCQLASTDRVGTDELSASWMTRPSADV